MEVLPYLKAVVIPQNIESGFPFYREEKKA